MNDRTQPDENAAFFRQLVHDLRIDLNHISLLAHKLQANESLPEPTRVIGEKIQKAVSRAAGLLATGGSQDQAPQELRINDVIRDMQSTFEVECENHGVKAVLQLDDRVSAIQAVKTDLEVILRNLLTNAIEAMPNGGILTIETVSAQHAPRAQVDQQCPKPLDADVIVSVTDTGTGMSEQLRNMIFQPFFSTKGAGRGIGLSGIESLARRNNIAVSVCSAPGAGTRFQLLFCSHRDAVTA